ncbi:DUF1772 domain-containing protein [Myxococcus llanfairpwllgwyngyllgogerychwyrndrobwllllantysiliogogogochensis]|uniref:DUF1772 domain-containing protein n=1 Tax=Myxococcus llanfairpwllgwyngyllgogerychwyrndrobwllllantysiliogogogochensis TaxID=2590453 RepID=A0A540X9S1_9BACT|nr:DUF1772 domain-containing protein [Myxococcus llanfairpwllgwyngyllgogerychwyrndrobwllllantysiliogogogochensis]TQF18007.1 DUF1772 domain-containing protein [Myxococcus llanfairpwllgwyngyllgogerychwyrndrobwllllantysiliogogogochensis]
MMNLKPSAAEIFLWLFVLNLGVSLGAGLYEHRIVLPRWLDATGAHWFAEAARQDNVGLRFWAFVSTGPLTLLTLASLFFATRATGPLRTWWLAAAVVALVDRLLTFSYFIPTMMRLMQASDTSASVESAVLWARLNHLRHLLVAGAWFASLQALSWLRLQGGR